MKLTSKVGGPWTLEDASAAMERAAEDGLSVVLRRTTWAPGVWERPGGMLAVRVPTDTLGRVWEVWCVDSGENLGLTNEGHEVWAAEGRPTFAVEPGVCLPGPWLRVKAEGHHVGLPVISHRK